MRRPRRPLLTPLALLSLALVGCGGGSSGGTDPDVQRVLTVLFSGDGAGSVTSSPAGVNCSAGGPACAVSFDEGASVTLTATASGSHAFTGWSGACSGTGTCTVTMSADRAVTAGFDNTGVTTQSIGASGGTVASPDGALGLTFPSGAVASAREITVASVEPSSLTGALATIRGAVGITKSFELGPDGSTFSQPVQFSVQTGGTVGAASAAYQTGVALLTSGSTPALPATQTIDVNATTGALTISGTLTHFSNLASTGNAFTWEFQGPAGGFFAGEPVNSTVSVFIPPSLTNVFPTGTTVVYRDGGSVGLTPGFTGSRTLVGSGGTFSGSIPYTCSAAGSVEARYSFEVTRPGGGTLTHSRRRSFTCSLDPQDPPVVTQIRSTLSAPITIYNVTATDPEGGPLSYHWTMSGEQCGSPRVPWYQTGQTVQWSHSDGSPDSCTHLTSDHGVVAEVLVLSAASDLGRVCEIGGSATLTIPNPPCSAPTNPLVTFTWFGTGGGTVSGPGGLSCLSGTSCSGSVPWNEDATFTAVPGSNSDFCGWFTPQGTSLGSSPTLVLDGLTDRTVRTCFNTRPPAVYALQVGGFPGSGSTIAAGTYNTQWDRVNSTSFVTVPLTVDQIAYRDVSRGVLGLDPGDPVRLNVGGMVWSGVTPTTTFDLVIEGRDNPSTINLRIERRSGSGALLSTITTPMSNGTLTFPVNSTFSPSIVITNESPSAFFDFRGSIQRQP